MKEKEIVKTIQEWWKEGIKGLKTKTVEKFGFDTSLQKIEFGNFLLIKDNLFGGYDLKIKDKDKDLDNLPYNNNKNSFMHLEALFKQNIPEIHSDELKSFNINTRISPIIIRNIKLTQSGLSQRYKIELNDIEKGPDEKWLDKSIDFKKILICLHEYKFTLKKYNEFSEVNLNSELETHFKHYFERVAKSVGKQKGLFDIVLGDMMFVIELKLASSLKKTGERQRASGQVKQYITEFNSRNFLFLVAGDKSDKQDKNVKSLEFEILKEFKCYYYYLEAE